MMEATKHNLLLLQETSVFKCLVQFHQFKFNFNTYITVRDIVQVFIEYH